MALINIPSQGGTYKVNPAHVSCLGPRSATKTTVFISGGPTLDVEGTQEEWEARLGFSTEPPIVTADIQKTEEQAFPVQTANFVPRKKKR